MAGSAKIGALMVSLGLNSAQFDTGLKKSQTGLANFGKMAGAAFKAVAVGAAAGAAMGYAVKSAIDHADALSKNAQKAGVTTESLSRLAYAADFADVSMEGLTSGLTKLSKSMADSIITKTSTSALAFKALGISVTDANGKLRNSDVVFSEISDRFSRMNDGATKTSLAMAIFGKSGAELIPLLNSGSAELKRMADEADRLGITLSTKTGKDAERFNDTLTLIGKVLQGVVNQVTEAALPALQSLAQTLADPAFAQAAKEFAATMVGALKLITDAAISTVNAIGEIGKAIAWASTHDMMGNRMADPSAGSTEYRRALFGKDGAYNKLRAGLGDGQNGPGEGFFNGIFGAATPSGSTSTNSAATFDPIIQGAGKAKKELIDLTENVGKFTDSSVAMASAIGDTMGSAFSRLADAVLSGNDALSETVNILMDLGKQLVSGAISNFFGSLFTGGLTAGAGLGSGSVGRGVYGGSGGFFPGFPGFEGGGYTGSGSRTGGMDGKGGFAAMLHPNETVIDHAKGGGMSEVLVRLSPGLEAQILQKAAGQSVQIASEAVQQQSPAVNAKARRNKVIG